MASPNIDLDAFASSQVQSKLWLVKTLERVLEHNEPIEPHLGYDIWILAGWYALINFMLQIRSNLKLNQVRSFDLDPSCERIADKINGLWVWKNWEFKAETCDINQLDYAHAPHVIINSSVEHMSMDLWWEKIPKGVIVCLQASDMDHDDHCNKFYSTQEMLERYQLSDLYYEGVKRFEYDEFSFHRYMIIGVK